MSSLLVYCLIIAEFKLHTSSLDNVADGSSSARCGESHQLFFPSFSPWVCGARGGKWQLEKSYRPNRNSFVLFACVFRTFFVAPHEIRRKFCFPHAHVSTFGEGVYCFYQIWWYCLSRRPNKTHISSAVPSFHLRTNHFSTICHLWTRNSFAGEKTVFFSLLVVYLPFTPFLSRVFK